MMGGGGGGVGAPRGGGGGGGRGGGGGGGGPTDPSEPPPPALVFGRDCLTNGSSWPSLPPVGSSMHLKGRSSTSPATTCWRIFARRRERPEPSIKYYGDIYLAAFLVGGTVGRIIVRFDGGQMGAETDDGGDHPDSVFALFGLTYFAANLWQVAALRVSGRDGCWWRMGGCGKFGCGGFSVQRANTCLGNFSRDERVGNVDRRAGGIGGFGAQWRYAYLVGIVPALLIFWVRSDREGTGKRVEGSRRQGLRKKPKGRKWAALATCCSIRDGDAARFSGNASCGSRFGKAFGASRLRDRISPRSYSLRNGMTETEASQHAIKAYGIGRNRRWPAGPAGLRAAVCIAIRSAAGFPC